MNERVVGKKLGEIFALLGEEEDAGNMRDRLQRED